MSLDSCVRTDGTDFPDPLEAGGQRIIRSCALLAIILSLCPVLGAAPKPSPVASEVPLEGLEARVRLAAGEKTFHVVARGPLTLEWGGSKETRGAGAYTIQASGLRPGRQRFHLFTKTFLPAEARQAEEYRASWKTRGYRPEMVIFGRRMRARGGRTVDSRSLWISLARVDTEAEAESLRKRLEKEEIWGWIRSATPPLISRKACASTMRWTPATSTAC